MPPFRPSNPICCAIDRPDLTGALALVETLKDDVGIIKLGLEFFIANGAFGVTAVAAIGVPLFLDLKLHDIPKTVEGSVAAVARLPVDLLTLHASGGRAMLEAAVRARNAAGGRLRLLGVTVLTSLDASDLEALGIARSPADQVLALAEMALSAGLDGLVCSPHEVAALRRRFGFKPLLVVPGIRPERVADDQKRTLDPRRARELGADLLVIGRPITAAAEPRAAARAICESLGEGAHA
jgi:orotidine-5'-phosphate decarboxylase